MLVGMGRLELPTSRPPDVRASQLRYIPNQSYLKINYLWSMSNLNCLMRNALMKLFCTIAFVVLAVCVEAEDNAIIASVNGDPITVLDVVLETGRREAFYARRLTGKELDDRVEKLRKSALESIIDRRLIYAEYVKQPFKIPKQYIEDAMDELAEDFGSGDRSSLEIVARRYGTTMAELRKKSTEKVAVEVLVNEFCRRPSVVTPKNVFEFYRDNPVKFKEPHEYKLYLLALKKQGRDQDEFNATVKLCERKMANINVEKFMKLAAVYSEDGSSKRGGEIGWVKEGEGRSEFLDVIRQKSVGEVARVDLEKVGTFFFYIEAKRGGGITSFKEVRADIKRELERAERVKLYKSYVGKLKHGAVIRRY